ncbi:hypothetical protein [Neobacillus sp. YIM B06451]|uniref:hypothetical protein n=1 Tax=Neobacillus sp. YIM B06451 TaxID=3070994 RepID=UPI002930050A|nr:hypothetical protein [Neobacillus sp. YIM B06451]
MVNRKHIDAKKIIKPTFQSAKECGCKEDRIGLCPMSSDLIPDEENGCDFCRKVKGTWDIKERILGLISEDDLKHLDYYDLDEKDNVKHIIDSCFKELGYLQAGILFSFVKQNCSFENDNYAIRVEGNGKVIAEGRHRVKIAQNMGIEIPVHWY